MTAPISNGPTTHGYTTMRDATRIPAASVKRPSGINERALKTPGVGAPAGHQLFHVKRPNVRFAACAEKARR